MCLEGRKDDGFHIRVKMKTIDVTGCSPMDNFADGFNCEITTKLRVGDIPWESRDSAHIFILKFFNKIDVRFDCSTPDFCAIVPGWTEYGSINESLVFHNELRTWSYKPIEIRQQQVEHFPFVYYVFLPI